MLTQDQKDKLESLTKHERYGKLLIDALISWETNNPKQKMYGVTRWNNEIKSNWEVRTDRDGCCLVGASILGKSESDSFIGEATYNFGLVISEILSLANGFDLVDQTRSDDVNAYNFGKQVAEILFHDSK